ncbi:hypothetical protein Tco_0666193 [Tanacetum coccineum]
MNGISHPYQKLKGFYKGVLNLGTDYIQDEKMEEWLTRGHISMHEMEWYQDRNARFPIIYTVAWKKEISMNIDEEFTNLEILKCWSLETSRRVLYKVEDIATCLVKYVSNGMIVGIKRLHDDLEVTAVMVCVTAVK